MSQDNDDTRKTRREKHSLVGTNQAGEGPGETGNAAEERGNRGAGTPSGDTPGKPALPGTNQAGKGPGKRGKRGRVVAGDA